MKWRRQAQKRIYLDNAAATPVRAEVRTAMQPYFAEQFGNASAIHAEGQQAAIAVADARLKIARALGIRPNEVTFTASGSESNNLALYGYVRHLHEVEQVPYGEIEIISTKIEHPSVLEVLVHLESIGVLVRYVDLSSEGVIVEASLQALISPKTRLVTFAYANSEIGTVQPVKRITRSIRKYNADHQTSIKTHLDASQAPLWLSCQMTQLGVDMMTLDAGKCQGPKGVGVLAGRNIQLKGIVLGGGQESGLRAGTENTAGIVGTATAIALAQSEWKTVAERVRQENALLWQHIKQHVPAAELNGSDILSDVRLPNNLNISLPGIDSEFAVVVLDKNGIAASTKSACSGAGSGESAVVKAITDDTTRASSTIRFSLGSDTALSVKNATKIANILQAHYQAMQSFDSTTK